MVQYKKYINTIGIDKVWEFEGAISQWHSKTKLCILVSDGKNTRFKQNNGFSSDAYYCANDSLNDILLTNYDDLFTNFNNYRFKNLTDIGISQRIEENFQQFREENKEEIHKIRKDQQDTIYFLKMIILILLLIIIFSFYFLSRSWRQTKMKMKTKGFFYFYFYLKILIS